MSDRKLLDDHLEAYHDRELSWWRRRRVEAGLRRSPELRRDLEALQQMSNAAAAADSPLQSPDLWLEISSQLHAIDADKRPLVSGPAKAEPSGGPGLAWNPAVWKPTAWVATAAAAMLAVGLWNAPGLQPPGTLPDHASSDETQGGVLRYLDTGGRPVVVLEREDVTIIWLMDAEGGPSGA